MMSSLDDPRLLEPVSERELAYVRHYMVGKEITGADGAKVGIIGAIFTNPDRQAEMLSTVVFDTGESDTRIFPRWPHIGLPFVIKEQRARRKTRR